MTKTRQDNAGLLVLRAGLGGVLVAHGVQKLFGWLGGHGLTATGAAFEQMGFRPGKQSALAAGLGEAGGGVFIALGLATPVAGAAAAGTMIPAAPAPAPTGVLEPVGGDATRTPPCWGSRPAALTLMGPGDWSLDATLGHRLNRPWMSAIAILASSVVSLAIVLTTQPRARRAGRGGRGGERRAAPGRDRRHGHGGHVE